MRNLYVSLHGNDAWTGTMPDPNPDRTDGPFASLERARDEIRKWKTERRQDGVAVCVRGGRYELREPFLLEAQDAGTETAPVVYRAYNEEPVILSGGRAIPHFEPVADAAILKRLPEAARAEVRQATLSTLGVSDLGAVAEAGNRIELFYDNRPMPLARWPNEGFTNVVKVVGETPFTVHGITGDRTGRFIYDADRPACWKDEPDPWLHGYWFWDWSDAYQRVAAVDATRRIIELEPPYHHYGYRNGQRYYGVNLLCELDMPGEWYLDRRTAVLYFWPPGPVSAHNVVVSVLSSLISIVGARWITLQGFILEATRGTAVTVRDSARILISGCTIRNTGAYGASIEGGTACGVHRCTIHQTGEGGIVLHGGDRPSLTPGEHYADDNHIHAFGRLYRTYRPAVRITGVGNRITHNRIHDGPHNAIQLNGNDHLIEYNEIYDVCYETGDVGAFYMGRDWSERGTVIRYNYFHDIRGPGLHGAMAVYLDDAASGITVCGNVFVRASRAAFIGGGRDNTVENNVFVACNPSVHVDARGMNWMRDIVEGDSLMPQRLAAMPYTSAPWRERYPELPTLLNDAAGAPKGNRIVRNISIDGPWSHIEELARPLVLFEDNLIDRDPHFVDAGHGNYALRDDSPAWGLGFKPIPVDKIGNRRAGAPERDG
jgi:hypothetical protein